MLECVITCVNYADFLAATLPHNRHQFDYMVVVTTPDDYETQRLCEFWHVDCRTTPLFRQGGPFRKGAGINVGLNALSKRDWVMHLDADVFLPPLARQLLDRAALDPACLYGADRVMVPSYESWQRFLRCPALQQEDSVWVHSHAFPPGVRVASPDFGGYVPIGFFQLWCPSKSGVKSYPDEHTTAGRGDMIFTQKWPRAKRGLVPEFMVYHLESGPAEMGANWNGRKTPPFGPPPLDMVQRELVQKSLITSARAPGAYP
jgi:hypothetical protein